MRNSRMFGIVSTQNILESGCDNDYKRHHGSHVTNAASSELGDLHRQAVPQRFFPVTEDKMKLTSAESKLVFPSSTNTE